MSLRWLCWLMLLQLPWTMSHMHDIFRSRAYRLSQPLYHENSDLTQQSSDIPDGSLSAAAADEEMPQPISSFDLEGSKAWEAGLTKTGTTIVGLSCRDGIVLGADTRTTGGSLVMNKGKRKIHEITRLIHCCTAGTVADCDHVIRKTRFAMKRLLIESEAADSNGEDDGSGNIKSVVHIMAEAFIKFKSRRPEAAFIIGGWDRATRSGQLYTLDNGLPQQCSYCSLGSGSIKALSVLETECERLNGGGSEGSCYRNMTAEDAVAIVRKAVLAGIKNDLGSGSHIDFVLIKAGSMQTWREQQDPYHLPNAPTTAVGSSRAESAEESLGSVTASEESTTGDIGVALETLDSPSSGIDIEVLL